MDITKRKKTDLKRSFLQKAITLLSIFTFFLFVSLPGFTQTASQSNLSFFKKGQNSILPPAETTNTFTRSLDTRFVFTGNWCVISEIGNDGEEVVNDIYSTGECMVWFNEDGTYVVSNYRAHDIFQRRWWYLNDTKIN